MKCFWCHNPESLNKHPQLQMFPDKCIGCGACFELCPLKAHRLTSTGEHIFQRELCTGCGICSDACYAEALILRGYTITVDEVIAEILKDRIFYEKSNGGVTFSGGEPLLQKDFILNVLSECKANGLHTCIETAGNIPPETIVGAVPYVDLWLYDIKIVDEEKHIKITGASNKNIIENLKLLVNNKANVVVRIPVIPGTNDDEKDFRKIIALLCEVQGVKDIELLPFSNAAQGKYESLGMDYQATEINAPSKVRLEEIADMFTIQGFNVKIN